LKGFTNTHKFWASPCRGTFQDRFTLEAAAPAVMSLEQTFFLSCGMLFTRLEAVLFGPFWTNLAIIRSFGKKLLWMNIAGLA
jgi:hypothetical protein